MSGAKVFLRSLPLKQRFPLPLTAHCNGNVFSLSRRVFSSEQLEKLKLAGFEEEDAREIVKIVDTQLDQIVDNLADLEELKSLTADLESKSISTYNFAISNTPFQIPLITNQLPAQTGLIPNNTIVDPTTLEKEIQITGQQLTDDIRQLQADFLLDANLESKRDEKIDLILEEKLEQASEYAKEKVAHLNEHLDRVSTQVLTAIGGKSFNIIHFSYVIIAIAIVLLCFACICICRIYYIVSHCICVIFPSVQLILVLTTAM